MMGRMGRRKVGHEGGIAGLRAAQTGRRGVRVGVDWGGEAYCDFRPAEMCLFGST